VEIDHPELVYIEDDVLVGPYLQVKIDPLTGSLRMHRRAYLGRFGTIYARFPVVFGEAVMAGDQLCIGVDPPPDRNPGPVSIGAGTFVGVASVICSGVTIGAGSYVGAGSIVMNDMPPGYLIAGNPARPIKPLHG
jgi:acetyltransferase-like isoleucine patch superfamily enzyme